MSTNPAEDRRIPAVTPIAALVGGPTKDGRPPPPADLPSLADYFEDVADVDQLRRDADALRDLANTILRDQAGDAKCLFRFAKNWLGAMLLFGPAAKIFSLALARCPAKDAALANRLRQQLAVATYKNEEAPTRRRLENALGILADVPPLVVSASVSADDVLADEAETWALRGAVYRRLWDLDGKGQYLSNALNSYRRAHEADDRRDDAHFEGYGALNAAFLLDSLAFNFESIGAGPIARSAAAEARAESAHLRRTIVARVGKRLAAPGADQQEWLCETIAGAYLALGLSRWSATPPARNDDEEATPALLAHARGWTEKAVAQPRADWTRETTHAQWLRLAYINEPAGASAEDLAAYWADAASVINPFREKSGGVTLDGTEMAANARRGKVGLALSGGGFRASFYHLGVLARLAEVDALRHVDVLSTVSGGSIVGAHYYLLLRQLLQQKATPSREEYLQLVETLIEQFSAGVDDNLRMRGLSNLAVTLKLLFKPEYTRSNRMADLYDERLYARTENSERKRFPLRSLRIVPAGESDSFNPRFSNWRRAARVPALLINATCLNTGHSWHFTANWMGEPPELIGENVDKNERLRRVPYEKARGYQDLSLGFAVAASACVPGIFEPLRLPGLYPGRLVRLVDGGVHDNQGVDALIGQGCDFILCSDGSGQMGDETRPSNGPVGTPKRSMDILMKRVREAEHADMENRVLTGTRRGLFFVHLKSELPIDDVDWLKCDDPTKLEPRRPTSYAIDQQIQRYLSEIRTDLDSFSEVEACALMASGYAMTRSQLDKLNASSGPRRDPFAWGGFDLSAQTERKRWRFLDLDAKLGVPPDANDVVRQDLGRQLRAGSDLFFKQIKLTPWLVGALTVIALVVVGAGLWNIAREADGLWKWLTESQWKVTYLAGAIAAAVVAVAAFWPRLRVWCVESFFAIVGAIASNLYFACGLNRMFLRRGRLQRLLDLD